MPVPRSTDMTTASDRRPELSSGSDAHAEFPLRPITDALLAAIATDGRSPYALAKAADLDERIVRWFIRGERTLSLPSIAKLFETLGLKVVRESRGPGSKAGDDHSPQPLVEGLQSAITESGYSIYALAKKSGALDSSLRYFVRHGTGLALDPANKVAVVVGLKVVRVARPEVPCPEPPPQPFSDGLRSAIAAGIFSVYALAKESGVGVGAIYRLVRHQTSIDLVTANKLAIPLELRVVREARALRTEAGDDDPSQSLSDGLWSAIVTDGRSIYALAKASGVDANAIYRFVNHETDLRLDSSDKLAVVLGLKLIRVPKPRILQSEAPPDNLLAPLFTALRSAIAESGLSAYELARRSGVTTPSIYSLRRGGDIKYFTAIKLAKALGLELEPAWVRPPTPPPPTVERKSSSRDLATDGDASIDLETTIIQAHPPAPAERPQELSPWDTWDSQVCPVHIREDGNMIVFNRNKGPLKSGRAIRLVLSLVERYLPTGEGGFGQAMLERRFKGDPRKMFYRLRKIDADTMAAFQQPGPSKRGLFRIGRPAK